MNKYASLYLNKLSEAIDSDPNINKDSLKQDPTLAGGLGVVSSLFWPLGAAAPGLYAGARSNSLGESLKATGNGLLWPAVGTVGGAIGGATLGGVAGNIMDFIAKQRGSMLAGNLTAPGALGGALVGGLVGGPVAGYLGSRNAARRYNERLKQELDKNTNLLRDRQEA